MTNARISLIGPENMSEKQKEVYDSVVSGPRKMLIGPLRAALHNPDLADRWQKFGQVLRYETSLPRPLNELAILVTARYWNSDLEWTIHAKEARKAGLDEGIINALRDGRLPENWSQEEREIYEFSRMLLTSGQVDKQLYASICNRWNEVGVVELTALIGYYSMVAMTLNAHQIPLPLNVPSDLPPNQHGLQNIPAAS